MSRMIRLSLFLSVRSPLINAKYSIPPAIEAKMYASISGIPWRKYFVKTIGNATSPNVSFAIEPITKPMTEAFHIMM